MNTDKSAQFVFCFHVIRTFLIDRKHDDDGTWPVCRFLCSRRQHYWYLCKKTVVLTLVRRRYQFVRSGTHQCQQYSWISTCWIQHNNKWLHTTTMFKNTSFEWTIETSSNYIFINEFITYMVLNFKHVKNCDQYWHLSPKDFKNFYLWISHYCWKSTVLNSTWRLLTDSNLLKWNIFLKASFKQRKFGCWPL